MTIGRVWFLAACAGAAGSGAACGGHPARPDGPAHVGPSLPLSLLADVPLPGGATRFDYQELDPASGQLVVAHMDDDSVLVLSAADGSVRKELTGIPTPRGVAIAADAGII